MNMHNVFRECEEHQQGWDRFKSATVHPFLIPLIEAISRKRPTWRFVFTDYGSLNHDNIYVCTSMRIDDGDQSLGSVSKAWTSHGDSYDIHNQRMKDKTYRNKSTRTKDLKKATKLILDHFYGLTPEEHIRKALNDSRKMVGDNNANASYTMRSTYDHLRDEVTLFLMSNWDAFMAFPSSTPSSQQRKEAFPGLVETLNTVRPMNEQFQSCKGNLVVTLGEAYYVVTMSADGNKYERLTTDTVPSRIKEGVGLLKLVEPKKYIASVGTRVDNNVFFIMETEQ
jgi:hypothetical protein